MSSVVRSPVVGAGAGAGVACDVRRGGARGCQVAPGARR